VQQGAVWAGRAYPYMQRFVQNPAWPNTAYQVYQYTRPGQTYYYPPQYRVHGSTPYMIRKY
jgi:hypothetical protein